MSGSWLNRLKRWLNAEPASSGSFDPATFEKLCIENPAAARAALLADQRALGEEFEKTYEAYEQRIQAVAESLSQLKGENVEQEARTLREAQDQLRRLLRRVEASSRSARDLEREYAEWDGRSDHEGPWHADHPSVRAEIIRSELALRNSERPPVAIAPEASPFRMVELQDFITESEEHSPSARPMLVVRPVVESQEREVAEQLPSLDLDTLLQTIRMETREAERWHGAPSQDHDALEQVKAVRQLHAILKRLDRKSGIRRDRIVFAIRQRGTD
jgi:hypothetical protein